MSLVNCKGWVDCMGSSESWGRMYMHNLQLNFSDFCKYSCILEINYTQKNPPKYWLNVPDISVALVLKVDWFPIFPIFQEHLSLS